MLTRSRHQFLRRVSVCAVASQKFNFAYAQSAAMSSVMMKTAQVKEFGAPESIQVHETTRPVPKAGQVLVKIKAAGVNPVETYIRSGQYAHLPPLPWTPGKDAAGIVEDIGSDGTEGSRATKSENDEDICELSRYVVVKADGHHEHDDHDHDHDHDDLGGNRTAIENPYRNKNWLEKGARVWTPMAQGAASQYAIVNRHELFELPEHLSFFQGAALGVPYRTAYKALFIKGAAKAKPGNSILIHGASGAVGVALMQFAKAIGMSPIIATAGTNQGIQVCDFNGADYVLNHKQENHLQQLNSILELRNRPVRNKGVDLIIENCATANLGEDVKYLQRGGVVVVVGLKKIVQNH